MALFQCKFLSKSLFNNTDVTVYIPSMLSDQIRAGEVCSYSPANKFQVLYLLHGHSGDNQDWVTHTNIVNYVKDRQLALVMPNVMDSFYSNMVHGKAFWTYVSEELPLFICSMLPISTKREDTFVAGLSMGGFGALKLALNQPERFSAAISLSGLLDIADISAGYLSYLEPIRRNVFGTEALAGTENDLYFMLGKNVNAHLDLPKIYLACGSQDYLLGSNRRFLEKARSLNIDITYEEESGAGHEWSFWDKYILRGLDWLPLKYGPVSDHMTSAGQ